MSNRRFGRRMVVFAALFGAALLAAGTIEPTAPARPRLVVVRTGHTEARPALWQGVVESVGADGFVMTVDTVWVPVMVFDIGSRTVNVTDDTVFGPPVWNLDNLAVGEFVSVTVHDGSADPATASDVTVVDPD